MNFAKLLLVFFLFFWCSHQAQTVSGYVYDEAEDLPLEGAFVYLDGTTYSATTDAEGYFSMTVAQPLPADLIVSYIGFRNFRLPNPFQYGEPVKLLMRPDAINLGEVVINAGKSPFNRKDMMKAFYQAFIGETKAGRSCVILNEDDISFFYDEKVNTLTAYARKPLQIKNSYLEYHLVFDLQEFVIKYNQKTLASKGQRGIYFTGTTFFTDISQNNSAYDKRKEAYLGSVRHFMRSFAAGELTKQGFDFYNARHKVNPAAFFTVTDTLGVKKVTLRPEEKNTRLLNINLGGDNVQTLAQKQEKHRQRVNATRLTLVYNKEHSCLSFDTGEFYIAANGYYYPIHEVRFSGDMAERKAGDMLPADYTYP
ncbi:carboxypeptidase-like regulatory domain-containing protein [Flavobacterium sp.]|uniref:carboxypeptidase-like regulatory domain-containing protein n=1 Tax=Flavobacterium sp. TaxID=239 RepID=UPI002628E4F8|nr:carboxypeptidase-like regulatory domain-containing protein [Flavobacterium sp.]